MSDKKFVDDWSDILKPMLPHFARVKESQKLALQNELSDVVAAHVYQHLLQARNEASATATSSNKTARSLENDDGDDCILVKEEKVSRGPMAKMRRVDVKSEVKREIKTERPAGEVYPSQYDHHTSAMYPPYFHPQPADHMHDYESASSHDNYPAHTS